MRNAYWADPAYIHAVLAKIPSCKDFVQSAAGFPLGIMQTGSGVPHLFCPPGFLSPSTKEDFSDYLEMAVETARSTGAATGFLQFRGQAECEEIEAVLNQYDFPFSYDKRTSVYVSLSHEDEELISRAKPRVRSYIRALQKEGVYHRLAYNPLFQRLYNDLADDHNFSDVYRYNEKDIQAMLGSEFVTPISIYDGTDRYLGGALIGHYDEACCDYIITANDKDINISGRSVLWESLKAFRGRGHKLMNLGGGSQEGNELIRFKMSFGGAQNYFTSIKIVFDKQAYEAAYGPVPADMIFTGRFPPEPIK